MTGSMLSLAVAAGSTPLRHVYRFALGVTMVISLAACTEQQPVEPIPQPTVRYTHEPLPPSDASCCTGFEIDDGPNAGAYPAGEFRWTVPVATNFPNGLTGSTVFGGSGCIADVNGNGVSDRNEIPPAGSTGATIVVFVRTTCLFSEKVESAQIAGYKAVLIANSHVGSANGVNPDEYLCGGQGHTFTITASAVAIGHRAGHLIFSDIPGYTGPDGDDMPAIGTLGATVSVTPDTNGPTISNVSASPTELWPANKKMVDVTVNYDVADDCGVESVVLSVTSSDPVTGAGDVTSPDWEIVDSHHVRLRAERLGSSEGGRTYTITITATDVNGNVSTQTVMVVVPRSQQP